MKDSIFMYLVSNSWFNDDSPLSKKGWGNGYVALPKGHPWYEMDYMEIPVHSQELTYSKMQDGFWVIGFDTLHSWNDPVNSDMATVVQWTREIMDQAIEVCTEESV